MSPGVQRPDHALLLRGRELGEDGCAVGGLRQLGIVELRDPAAEQDLARRELDLVADLAGDDLVVAGEHLHLDAVQAQRGDRLARALFRRIEKRDVAKQREIALVIDRIGRLCRLNLLVGDRDDAESVGVQNDGLLLGALEMRLVEPAHRAVEAIARADREDLLDRALADQNVPAVFAPRPPPTCGGA